MLDIIHDFRIRLIQQQYNIKKKVGIRKSSNFVKRKVDYAYSKYNYNDINNLQNLRIDWIVQLLKTPLIDHRK
jgi:hypothetical protein